MQSNDYIMLLVGSQHLYGPSVLCQVRDNSGSLCARLNAANLPVPVTLHGIGTTSQEIADACRVAESDPHCLGMMVWMHTFSPAKMWIAGLQILSKPLLHLHTQHGASIPWSTIDMDYMNLHQSAHGGREFGHVCARLNKRRCVVVGHAQDPAVHQRIAAWQQAAVMRQALASTRIARFGDNMRQVAVTDGDKVGLQIALGLEVDGYGIGDLVDCLPSADDASVEERLATYESDYELVPELRSGGAKRESLIEQARIDIALDSFLGDGGYHGFTTTFEDLHGLPQLPGLAVQRQMAGGRGFGAEGDWKTAALLRATKQICDRCSFMEDYTYDFGEQSLVLGAHMLEVCPSIAANKPQAEVHPLGIGGKSDPARLVFEAAPGPAINLSLIDLGDRLRLLANVVDVQACQPLPNLPVARALWQPRPSLSAAAEAWILAGGAHHTVFADGLNLTTVEDFAVMTGIELVVINETTDMPSLRQQLIA